jgi:hypothetical protein
MKWIPLFSTNFLGVFNDNLLKNFIGFICIYWVGKGNESFIIMLSTAFLVLPFILVSPYAGYLSKIFLKKKIIFFTKMAEIPIVLFALTGFYFQNLYIVLSAMLLMGLQSTIYSPAKYGMIREIGGSQGISFGTGALEMLTFLGVLFGTFLAGSISDIESKRFFFMALAMVIIAVLGFLASAAIKVKESETILVTKENLNAYSFVVRNFKWYRQNISGLNLIVVGLSTFWLIGSMIQMNLLIHCPQVLNMTNTQTGIIMALVAVSIGLGCWVSGLIARKRLLLGLVPIGGVGLATGLSLIFIINPDKFYFSVLIMLTAFSAGIFKIPLMSWIQVNVEGRKVSDAFAYNNLMNFVFILASAGIFGLAESMLGSRFTFLIVALLAWILVIGITFRLHGVKDSLNQIFRTRKT